MEIIKCLLGRPKLQDQLTWHSLDKQIKQESDEEASSQKAYQKKKKHTHNGFVDNFGLQFKLWWKKKEFNKCFTLTMSIAQKIRRTHKFI
jgi:hypothetical protein